MQFKSETHQETQVMTEVEVQGKTIFNLTPSFKSGTTNSATNRPQLLISQTERESLNAGDMPHLTRYWSRCHFLSLLLTG